MSSVETFGVIGSGEFGRVVAEHLAPNGSDVLVFDNNQEAQQPKNTTRVDFSSIAKADIVVVAVPFDSYSSLIPELAEASSASSLIVDVCSVKVRPTEVFEAHGLLARENTLMTHPLFGPQSLGADTGKNVVVTKQSGVLADDLLEAWSDKGINRIDMTAEEHDREMAQVHVLPFIIGRGLLTMGITESSLGTNHFDKLLKLVDVEQHHSPELFRTIQRHNPFASDARTNLITTLCTLHTLIGAEGDTFSEAEAASGELSEFRGMVDVIDELRTVLLGLRFGVTDRIGCLKAEHGLPSKNPERERTQLYRIEEIAGKNGAPPELVSSTQQLVMDEVVRRHDEQKRAQGSTTKT